MIITALSRLNSFLDSELEQILCFDTEIDAEEFCNQKSAIFLIMPEEDPNKFFNSYTERYSRLLMRTAASLRTAVCFSAMNSARCPRLNRQK